MMSMVHLCYTSHDEVMYRSPADMNIAFNSLCSALHKTESRCLAEAFLPTHHHGCYYTENPEELIRTSRSSYTKQFNIKYERTGPLGEKGYFLAVLEGTQHQVTAVTYVNRNAVHHGIVPTPFAYPFCSANAFLRNWAKTTRRTSFFLLNRSRRRFLAGPRSIPLGKWGRKEFSFANRCWKRLWLKTCM